jgi:protein-L-isoaspartate(D-aspartate) O-methyltransferase
LPVPERETLSWIDDQLRRRGIRDRRVLDAMARVPRELFVPPEQRAHAYDDAALALSHGQTISQPFIVALIAQAVRAEPGDRVLDVGTGSGYQAAVLCELGAEVSGVERVPELAVQARENLSAAGYDVDVVVGDGALGLPDRAPFDGIAVAAAADRVPGPLYEQLADGGRLVLPIGESLVAVSRTPGGPRTEFLSPARFVPLVTGFSGDEPGMTTS